MNITIRKDFPILKRNVHNNILIYFDNAATTQKPRQVLQAMNEYYSTSNANTSRGVHFLGEEATNAYEQARITVAKFINAKPEETIFTSSTTHSINKVALWATKHLQENDEILLSIAEHHANILPWQRAAKKTGAKIVFVNLKDGLFDMQDYEDKLSDKTKFVCVSATSNVLGDDKPIKQITQKAHEKNAFVLIDYAQTIAHKKIDASIPDFSVFSAHKIYGPTGLGVLVVNNRVNNFTPELLGGGIVEDVTTTNYSLTQKPWCYEPGTPNVAGAIGLQKAIEYVDEIGIEKITTHLQELTRYTQEELTKIPEINIIGSKEKNAIISFTLKNMNANDVAMMLSLKGICVRTGMHCTNPLHKELNIDSSVRVSFALYNTQEEIDVFIQEIKKIIAKVKQ